MNQTDEITEYPCIIEVSNVDFEEHIKWEDDPDDGLVKKRVCIGKVQNRYICLKSKENQLENFMSNLTTPVKYSSTCGPTWVSSGAVSGLVLEFWRFGRKIEKKKFTEWLKS